MINGCFSNDLFDDCHDKKMCKPKCGCYILGPTGPTGPNSGVSITRTNDSTFNLSEIGTYQIFFNVPVTETSQLELILNGEPLDYTVVGRTTGTSEISGMFLVETTTINSLITVRNPSGNAAALTITPLAGGASPVSAHIVIIQIA